MHRAMLMSFMLITACSAVPQTDAVSGVDYAKYDMEYDKLVDQVKNHATPEQFQELREVYVFTSHYNPYLGPERAMAQAMFEAMDGERWDDCLDSAKRLLVTNYISLYGHFGAMECSFRSGVPGSGEFHKYVLDGLLDAIWATGDGKSAETAFYSTSTPELQAFIQLHGLETVSQALIHSAGKTFDLMAVRDPVNQKEFEWYFDISAQWAVGFKGLD